MPASHEPLQGLIAAPVTPYDTRGKVNLDVIAPYASRLKTAGVSGVFVNGTTGEGALLNVEERLALAEAWVAQAAQDFKVIVHIAHTCAEDCRTLVQHAARIGAWAMGDIGSYYYAPQSVKDLVSHSARTAAYAPELPYYYYHMPSVTGTTFSMLDYLEAAEAQIPNLAGIKYTHEDLVDYARCVQVYGETYSILFGRDELLLCSLALGSRAAVGSTYNFMAPCYTRMIDAFRRGDLPEARRLQHLSISIIKQLANTGSYMGALKTLMTALYGLDMGSIRSPLQPVSTAQVRAIETELRDVEAMRTVLPLAKQGKQA